MTLALRTPRLAVPALLAAATVLLEIGYPLTAGHRRDVLTVATVVVFFTASVSHALVTRGPLWTLELVTVTAGGGLLVEAAGIRTGVPFGDYAYADSLGWKLAGVPVVVPLAWTMMAYPCAAAARRLTGSRAAQVVVAAWGLATWDLFLDPQMVDAGHWRWADVHSGLPGVPEVPAGNYAGWFVVALVMFALLPRDPIPRTSAADRLPLALFLWTYASSVLAHAAFLGLHWSALWGGLGMGAVALPLAAALRRPPASP